VYSCSYVFFFQAEDGIRDFHVTGVQTCALPISEQALAQAQKIAAIGQLTLGIAHDFNNLLAVITASLDQMPRAEGQRREVLIDAARQAADRGARLTRQMLAFARGQRLEPALHDVNTLI